MASGDVKVAELGSSPLAIAASQGVDLQMFMLAQVIGTAESADRAQRLGHRDSSRISRASASPCRSARPRISR